MKDQDGKTVKPGDEVMFTVIALNTMRWRKGVVARISPHPATFRYLGGMAEIVAEGETVQDGISPRFAPNIRRL